MSIFIASILVSSCSSSIKSESNRTKIGSDKKEINFVPATDEDIFLYRQIGISYLCMARQIEVEFPKAISSAAKNYALLISSRHGGLIKELGKEKIPDKNIFCFLGEEGSWKYFEKIPQNMYFSVLTQYFTYQ